MPVNAYRCASLDALSHTNVRLDCAPETIRAIWKAETTQGLEQAMLDGGVPARTIAANGWMFETQRKRWAVCHLANFFAVVRVPRSDGELTYYCAAGDDYAPTLAFTNKRLFVTTAADLRSAHGGGCSHE